MKTIQKNIVANTVSVNLSGGTSRVNNMFCDKVQIFLGFNNGGSPKNILRGRTIEVENLSRALNLVIHQQKPGG